MKLSATHAFNCVVLRVKFGLTSCEDIPPALVKQLYISNKVEYFSCKSGWDIHVSRH